MSNAKSVGSPDLSENKNAKSTSTPSTVMRTAKVTKKRPSSVTDLGDEAEEEPIDMELSTSLSDALPMRPLVPDTPSPLHNHPLPNPSLLNPCAPVAPSLAARPPAPQPGLRQPFINLSTCIRLSPAVPPGRMELVQTGIKLELAVANLPRAGTRGLEDYVNERAARLRERPYFTVERIKIYSQPGEVVLFGKIGTAYDVRALHYLFCDLAKGSQLSYCPNTFPDLTTALQIARPWFNQGECHTHADCFLAYRRAVVLCCVSAEYVLEANDGADILYVYDKLNSYRVVQDAQAEFPLAGAYYNARMHCLVFPTSGKSVLRWLETSNRIVMTEKADYEGAQTLIEPLDIPDDL